MPDQVVLQPSLVQRIFTATLIIGVPGSGKTSLLKTFAEYLWETHKRVLLLYSWDGGAIPTMLQQRMKQGLIRFWRARTRSALGLDIETLYLGTKGYWPATINPDTGETPPAVRLVPPVTVNYTASCPKGHRVAQVPAASMLARPLYCNDCKAMIPPEQLVVVEQIARTKGFELVGGVAYDGLTSMSNVVLEHMDHARGAGEIGGEKSAFGGVVTSGVIKLGGNNRADVGFGQTRALQFVNNALGIPHLVEGPVFTALSMEVTDEGGLQVVGAKLPGRAATDEASSWFGNVYETAEHNDEQGKKHFCLFLRPFTDAQNRRHLLKTSASPMALPDRLLDPAVEENKPFAVANLGNVYRMLDEDLRRQLAEELPNAPAVPSTYGEPITAELTPAPPPGSGIPPLTSPASASTAGPGAGAARPAVAPPVALQTPRGRRRGAAPATVVPAASQPAPNTTAASAPPPVVATSTASAMPPPPGMRPPQRAPGT